MVQIDLPSDLANGLLNPCPSLKNSILVECPVSTNYHFFAFRDPRQAATKPK
jgi:hypothetical protein